jgi:hypothetical protein
VIASALRAPQNSEQRRTAMHLELKLHCWACRSCLFVRRFVVLRVLHFCGARSALAIAQLPFEGELSAKSPRRNLFSDSLLANFAVYV